MKNLRILIADDHDLMRRGLKALVESHPGWQVCDEAYTGHEAIAKVEKSKPDIVILRHLDAGIEWIRGREKHTARHLPIQKS